MKEIHVSVKQLGKKHPLLHKKKINLNTDKDNITLSQFISLVVEQQVQEYNNKKVEREDEDSTKFPQHNYLPILTDTGKIGFGSIYNEKKADLAKAQETALQAFEDGMYAIFQEEEQLEQLTQPITLTNANQFTFIRLTFLTGSYW